MDEKIHSSVRQFMVLRFRDLAVNLICKAAPQLVIEEVLCSVSARIRNCDIDWYLS